MCVMRMTWGNDRQTAQEREHVLAPRFVERTEISSSTSRRAVAPPFGDHLRDREPSTRFAMSLPRPITGLGRLASTTTRSPRRDHLVVARVGEVERNPDASVPISAAWRVQLGPQIGEGGPARYEPQLDFAPGDGALARGALRRTALGFAHPLSAATSSPRVSATASSAARNACAARSCVLAQPGISARKTLRLPRPRAA